MFVKIISLASFIIGGPGSKEGALVKPQKNHVHTLMATFLTQSFLNLLRIFVLIITQSHSVIGGQGSKSRSLWYCCFNKLILTSRTTGLKHKSLGQIFRLRKILFTLQGPHFQLDYSQNRGASAVTLALASASLLQVG